MTAKVSLTILCRNNNFAGTAMSGEIKIRRLEAIGEKELAGLSDVLMDCVEGGASVSFMSPMMRATAETFWRGAAAATARGERLIVVAEDDAGILGTVTVILNLPENQPHRAEVAKMLVHRRARRRGVGAMLLTEAERWALERGKTLLTLDTVSGSAADRLYARQGWKRCGEVPNFALWPDGRFCAATIFYKELRPHAGAI
jgi:GNAT superfamily N-acetyltransferase